MSYEPKPIDTSSVVLPEDVRRLAELLARNIHDSWAHRRLSEGWRYGPRRDDERKEHPDLVSYEDLPESEKEYDRTSALDTLAVILSLGYRIEAPSSGQYAGPGGDLTQRADQTSSAMEQAAAAASASLALWQDRDRVSALGSLDAFRAYCEALLRQGTPLLVSELVSDGLERWPGDVRLRQLCGLALAGSGLPEEASRILTQLREEGNADEETLGMLARTHKDLALRASDPVTRDRELREAHQIYRESYERDHSIWTGINAATTALLLGDEELAREIASRVRDRCQQAIRASGQSSLDPYWVAATLGEASLVLEDRSEAKRWYCRAAEAGRSRFGDLSSTRRNARLLLEHFGCDPQWLDECLPMARVVVFAGHMVDRPEREVPRFPAQIEPAVAAAIRERLHRLNGRIGFASAACGSDILFLEAIRDLGGEVHVILPYEETEFMQDSVEVVPGSEWPARFRSILECATDRVIVSGQRLESDGLSYDYNNMVLHGLAQIRAEELGTELVPLAVWNGRPGDGPGGTASVVERWRDLGLGVEIIDLSEILARECPEAAGSQPAAPTRLPSRQARRGRFQSQIMAMLFGDVVKFSQLTEGQITPFVESFLGSIGELLRTGQYGPVGKNTWGDGLYFVFGDVRTAGLFALDLRDLVTSIDWAAKGLRKDLNLRIGLHAGPIYVCTDPITGSRNVVGTHVSRAARIEPITPPGQVYASQAFAALATLEGVQDFSCEYVRQVEWAKHYGTFPTYLVRRHQEPTAPR